MNAIEALRPQGPIRSSGIRGEADMNAKPPFFPF
jgi:hypothetical protein